jgi:hypothetical protein
MSKNKNGKKRDMISSPQFIISAAKQFIRSTGNLLDQASDKHSFSYYCNNIVDTEYFRQYTTLLSASGNADSLINVGAISLDGLYVGYSTSPYYTGLLPHFESPTETGAGVINVNSLNPFNPSNMYGTGVNNIGLVDTGTYNPSGWAEGGHNILAAMTANRIASAESLESGVHSVSNYFDADFYYRKKTELLDIRSVAHRAPLILSGPGYDISGNPVPTGESGIMHPQAYSDPSLWKTGPLDIRWDDGKKIWKASGGAGEFISFVVDNVSDGIGETSAGCNYVLATVTDIGHQTTAASIGDTGVKIFDEDFCYFNLPIPVLIGIKGKAIAYRNTYASYDVPPSGTGVCITQDIINSSYRWVVTGLCCGEEVFDA